jgi:DNA-binding PadR family transcriptional regulator
MRKLENILLGVLLGRPSTGYDLKKFLDRSGRFLRSNTQMSQVYRALAGMEQRGWVEHTVRPRPGAQDAKTYTVTAEGATVFLDWLKGPYHPPTRFEEPDLPVRLTFAGFMNVDDVIRLLDTEIAARQGQIAQYRFRDRSADLAPALPFDAELAGKVANWAHLKGVESMDAHVDACIALRHSLSEGGLPDPDARPSQERIDGARPVVHPGGLSPTIEVPPAHSSVEGMA